MMPYTNEDPCTYTKEEMEGWLRAARQLPIELFKKWLAFMRQRGYTVVSE